MSEQKTISEIDRVLSVVKGYVQFCLGGLKETGEVPRPCVLVGGGGGWTVSLIAVPTAPGEDVPALTACESDCLALLSQQRNPQKATLIRARLEAGGRIWAAITVKRSLARLRHAGLLCNAPKHPKGYYIPEAVLPILRCLSRT